MSSSNLEPSSFGPDLVTTNTIEVPIIILCGREDNFFDGATTAMGFHFVAIEFGFCVETSAFAAGGTDCAVNAAPGSTGPALSLMAVSGSPTTMEGKVVVGPTPRT